MNIDERLASLTMNLELLSHSTEAHDRQIGELKTRIDRLADSVEKRVEVSNQDATNIRALARLAEANENRISHLERP